MKRSLFVLIAVCFLFAGCLGLETTESQDFAIKKLSRIAGITLALEKPEEIDRALSYIEYVQGLDNANLRQSAIDMAVKYAYEKYGKTSKTIIMVAEVVDLINTVVPPDINLGTGKPIWDSKSVDIALAGFKEGLILAR